MWIMTTRGFFSAVQDRGNKNRVMVRARNRADLENFVKYVARFRCASTYTPSAEEIIENQGTDYPCRVFVSKAIWAQFVGDMSLGIDYTNFKNRIAEIPGQRDKVHYYHEVWGAMRKWQGFREGTDTTFGINGSVRGDELFDLGPQGPAGVARSRRNGKEAERMCGWCGKTPCECLPYYAPGAVACGICGKYPCICPKDKKWDMTPKESEGEVQ